MTARGNLNKLSAFIGALMLATLAAVAEESGPGHYIPGQTADFIDALPGYPSLEYENTFTYYKGSAGAGRPFPTIGQVELNEEATSHSDSSVLRWQVQLKVFRGYYNVFASLPKRWLS